MNWLDRLNDVPGGNALRYYLGPAYEPVNALAQFGASMLPGADMVDMADNSQRLMDYQGPMETLGDAGWLGLSALGMALPGRPGALRIERKGKTLADAYVGDEFAGTIAISESHPFVTAVDVEPRFRKQGIGRELYAEAEAMAGRPLVPSPLGLTDSATDFWQSRLSRMPAAEANRLLDESMEIGRSYGIRDEHITPRLAPLRQQERGITAYHGSPHDFDRFDMGKIGTGEGAQAYGHGLYFAENEGVAKSYRDTLAGTRQPPAVSEWAASDPMGAMGLGEELQKAAASVGQSADRPEAMSQIINRLAGLEAQTMHPAHDRAQVALDEIVSAVPEDVRTFVKEKFSPAQGKMYEVRINANPDDFLDWDKPLSEQSEKVRSVASGGKFSGWEPSEYEPNVIRRMGPRGAEGQVRQIDRGNGPEWLAEYDTLDGHGSERFKTREEAQTWVDNSAPIEAGRGAEIYQQRRKLQSDAEITAALREAGIPGIRYLDQGSRTAGEGSRNYVVFDENLIEILRKYGMAGLLAGVTGTNALTAASGDEGERF